MKEWYEFYMADDKHREILHQVCAKLQESENQNPINCTSLVQKSFLQIVSYSIKDILPSVEELTKRLDRVEQEFREYKERDKRNK